MLVPLAMCLSWSTVVAAVVVAAVAVVVAVVAVVDKHDCDYTHDYDCWYGDGDY